MKIFGLIYLGIGVAASFLDPRMRALQIKSWSIQANERKPFVKPLGVVAIYVIMIVLWPVCLYYSVRKVIRKRKLKKKT